MKKVLNFFSWFSVFCTIISLVMTLGVQYSFINEYYLQSYNVVQYCMFFTMVIWSIKVLTWKETSRNRFYSACCLMIAIGTAVFMFNNIY